MVIPRTHQVGIDIKFEIATFSDAPEAGALAERLEVILTPEFRAELSNLVMSRVAEALDAKEMPREEFGEI